MMSVHGMTVKKRAVKSRTKFQNQPDKIGKLETETLYQFDHLKNVVPHGEIYSQPFGSKELTQPGKILNVSNARGRKDLYDPFKELQKIYAAKFDVISDTIQLAIEGRRSEKEINEKMYAALMQHFDKLHNRAMNIIAYGVPRKWNLNKNDKQGISE